MDMDMILRAARDMLEMDDALAEEYRHYEPEDHERLRRQLAEASEVSGGGAS